VADCALVEAAGRIARLTRSPAVGGKRRRQNSLRCGIADPAYLCLAAEYLIAAAGKGTVAFR